MVWKWNLQVGICLLKKETEMISKTF